LTDEKQASSAPRSRSAELVAALPATARKNRFESKDSRIVSLWRQTFVEGIEIWKISEDLKIGDALHHGLFENTISNDQHWALIREFEISNPQAHGALLGVLTRICTGFDLLGSFDRANGNYSKHKHRLLEISTTAEKLHNLIQHEPLIYRLLCPPLNPGDPRLQRDPLDFMSRHREQLEDYLMRLAERTAVLVENDTLFKEWRVSNPSSKKSPERMYIWEPLFEFWTFSGRDLGYSSDGPVMRVVRILHEVFGLDEPSGPSVRRALIDFKKDRKP
jgi:hypothetical protein